MYTDSASLFYGYFLHE